MYIITDKVTFVSLIHKICIMCNSVYRFIQLFVVFTVVGVISMTSVRAQGLRTSYFMDNVPIRLKMNPAFQPMKGFFSIPVIGSLGVMASSNSLSVKNFKDILDDKNGFLSQKFINNLEKDNTMTIDFNTDVISLGFYTGKDFWTINMGARAIINASIPKTMFEFARMSSLNIMNESYDIRNIEINADIFSEIALGYSREVSDGFYIGGRAKALIGLGNLKAKIERIYANLPDAESSINNGELPENVTTWEVETKGRLEASMKGLELITDGTEGYVDDVDFDKFGVSGFGFGLDLGASLEMINNLHISAAILDLGFITWTKSSSQVAVANEKFNYGTVIQDDALANLDPNDYENWSEEDKQKLEQYLQENSSTILNYDLFRLKKEEAEGRTTSLRSTLNLGAEYTFWNDRLGIGLLSSTQFVSPKAYSELTLSANFRPGNAFGASVSYSFLRGKTVGLGLKLGPVFLGTDYIMTENIEDSKRLNAHIGISVGLGKKRVK